MQNNFLDRLPRSCNWEPPTPPELGREEFFAIDTETQGLDWWDQGYMVGVSICSIERKIPYYLPCGHHGGGNLSKEKVLEWMKRELWNKVLYGLNIRFDVHMIRKFGVDLEAQGNIVADVGHLAALLDDSRMKFNLNDLVEDYLGEEKVGKELDTTRMASYHAGEVAPRAEADVVQVAKLYDIMWPKIEEEGLEEVAELENEVIYAVCEMEKNGAPLDVEKLHQWDEEIEQEYLKIIYELYRMTGYQIAPNSNKDLKKLFQKFNLPMDYTSLGNASFTGAVLSRIDHPAIDLVKKARSFERLRSLYIDPYKQRVGRDGILRYALHQLRSVKEEGEQSYAGTVSGRFSSTAIIKNKVGVNIQQVWKTSKQRKEFGDKYIIRELFKPNPDMLWLSADASQIEYRLFAHYANNPKIIQRYKEDPEYSFHKMVHEQLLVFLPDLSYKRAKDNNFANIYGAGLIKTALMMEFISESQFRELSDSHDYRNPLLDKVREIRKIYKREIPEASKLLSQAARVAEDRGFVKTFLGRRSRFITHSRFHKALNAIIQGGAADIMKRKLVELHKARKFLEIIMRFTVHDEADCDVASEKSAKNVKELLNEQSYPFRVPILWDVNTGNNWMEASDD